MKSKKNIIEISEKEVILTQEKPVEEIPKQKKVLSDSQLEALAKAREKAKERKKELAELNAKSKGLKEEKLKLDAKEYDRIQKQKELDETVKKIEVIQTPQPPPPPQKKKIKKIVYESEPDEDDEEVEEVIIKKKKAPKQPSYSQLADMSVEQQIKNRLQQEKITCFFNQLTGKKY